MAFDGITVSCLVHELNKRTLNGRISKIAQPENDELILTIKQPQGEQVKLLLSASPSLPLAYITESSKQSPMIAPNFCMLLRKHIQNGRIIEISQPSLERIINFKIEHLNEMGDICYKTLVVELMGKHSNIIFLDEKEMIIDSIKHIPQSISSVREVLPGRNYFIPETTQKANPLEISFEEFSNDMGASSSPVFKALYSKYTGLSPFFSEEICHRANIDSGICANEIQNLDELYKVFSSAMDDIKNHNFSCSIVYENNVPFEYSSMPLTSFSEEVTKKFDSISSLLEAYYAEKELVSRIKQRSIDLRKIVQNLLEKDVKKYDLQLKQIKDTEKKDTYRIYGELLNTYGYNLEPNLTKFTTINYYTNEEITIPLDPDFTAIENAKKYFEKYNKLKRTKEALDKLTIEVKEEIEHLESIQNSLDIAVSLDDLLAIKEEMINSGYIKRHNSNNKKQKIKSKPFHYITKEGFHIYVGKNNLQNEEITFKVANGNDWWFHAKNIPGSHVIVKTEGLELPDSVFEDAAKLAAYYSKAKGQSRIEVDYVRRKEVKHPNGSKPGFVVYYTNYSMLIDSDISSLTRIDD
ncbi:MAG: NFACT family protein [Lachnospiraceae bacterium]|nr:NFACT family protein [Lachnospiraceae bacterium]